MKFSAKDVIVIALCSLLSGLGCGLIIASFIYSRTDQIGPITAGCTPSKDLNAGKWTKQHHDYQLDVNEHFYTLFDEANEIVGKAPVTWRAPLDKLIEKDNK